MNKLFIFIILAALLTGGAAYFHLKFDVIPRAKAQIRKKTANAVSQVKPVVPAAPVKGPETQNLVPSVPPNSFTPEMQSLTPSDLPYPAMKDPSVKMVNSEYAYDPSGRRDPFKPYIKLKKDDFVVTSKTDDSLVLKSVDSIESYTIDELKLVGIMWEVHDPKAMIKAPSNKVFMVRRQSRIGKNNGYIASIREGEIVVVEIASDGKTPSTRVISLQK